MTIRTDSQLLTPGSRVRLYELDATGIDTDAGVIRFHGHQYDGDIIWQGETYHPWPITAEGFLRTGEKPPNPTLTVANLDGSITAMCLLYDDLVGAILTVRSTLTKYLDAANFVGGNATANPAEHFPDEVWYLDRKEHEDHQTVRWSLASAMDFNGVVLPRRVIVANRCFWGYRSAECGYAGGPVATIDNEPTSDPALDDCIRTPNGCKKRFGENNPLPYGSFPAAGLLRS